MASAAASGAQEFEMNNVAPAVVGAQSGAAFPSGLRMRGREGGASYAVEDEEEEEEVEGVQQEPPTPEERKWGRYLSILSGLDIVLSGAIFITSFCFAYRDAGVSLWCMGIQAFSHLLSSLMLMLRFCTEGHLPNTDDSSASGLLRRQRRRSLLREQGIAITMGLVMLISSAGLLFKAFRKLRFWKAWYKDHVELDQRTQYALEFLAWYGFSVYFLQAVFRFVAARKLRRSLVWHGFVASVVSLVFLCVLGLAASYQKEWSWKAEPVAAIVLSFVCLAEGIRIVIMHLDDMETRLRFDPRA